MKWLLPPFLLLFLCATAEQSATTFIASVALIHDRFRSGTPATAEGFSNRE